MRILFFMLLAFSFIGCEKNPLSSYEQGDGFLLSIKPIEGQATKVGETSNLMRVRYYIVDEKNRIQMTPYASIAQDLSFIRVENLKEGRYRLIVLGESSTVNTDEISFSELNETSQDWLTCGGQSIKSLQNDYYYADHKFTVTDGVISDKRVELSRICGRVCFNIRSGSDMVAYGAVKKMELISIQNGVFSSLTGDGAFHSEKSLSEIIDITSNRELKLLPTLSDQPLQGRVAITSLCLDGRLVTATYNFQAEVVANSISTVHIDYKHPDDDNKMLYVPFQRFNSGNSNYILSNTESKSVYYNSAERSFNVKSPLQYGIDANNKFFIRFYSAVGITNVKFVWDDGANEIEFARFDTIPPFFEARMTHPLSQSGGLMQTTDGRLIKCKAIPNMSSASLKVSMLCNHPYMQKIKTIIPSINVNFASYGGDPDAANGSPNGNWMGIRPVHIREACAALTNMAFMVSTPDFADMVTQNAALGTYKNNNSDVLSAATVIGQYRANRSITAGLVWTGNGVAGLGGGSVWGVSQSIYFNHYTSSSAMWHEYGHCVGYSHASTMTYGLFAENHCQTLYLSMCKSARMPVSYSSILNSANNPNRY